MLAVALGIVASSWSTSHYPRYDITLRFDTLAPGAPVNDPRTDGSAVLGAGHVDGYIHRGCANNPGSIVLRLTDRETEPAAQAVD